MTVLWSVPRVLISAAGTCVIFNHLLSVSSKTGGLVSNVRMTETCSEINRLVKLVVQSMRFDNKLFFHCLL